MADAHALLTRSFLAWVDERPRDRAEVLDAWRSSCPRLAIWEDALAARLVEDRDGTVRLTARGVAARSAA